MTTNEQNDMEAKLIDIAIDKIGIDYSEERETGRVLTSQDSIWAALEAAYKAGFQMSQDIVGRE